MKSANTSFRMEWLLILVLPVIILIPYINQFVYQVGSSYSDLTISHLPNAIFLKATLLAGQGIPFWSPTILSGYPFYADPLSGLWYPPGWLSMLFPWPVGFNLLIIVHLIFGGCGLFLWLRKEGLKPASAMVGGLLFEAMPKLFAHFEAGHITLVCAVCWTPWLLLAEKTWGITGFNLVSFLKQIWRAPGVVLGLIFLVDSRWAAFSGIIWLAYTLWTRLFLTPLHRDKDGLENIPARWRIKFTNWISFFLPQLILLFMISAPLALPLLQYAHLSSRSALTPQEAFTLSLPPARLFGIIFPDIQGEAEWTLYPGCFGLIFTGLVVLSRKWRSRAGFWLWILLISVLYALGSSIPGLELIARLPGFDLLRVPSRALFGAGLAFACLSAYAVDGLIQPDPGSAYSKRATPNLFLSGAAFFVFFVTVGFLLIARSIAFNFAWGAACLIIAVIWTLLRLFERINPSSWFVGVLLISLINTGVVEFVSISPQSPAKVFSEGGEVASYLASQSSDLFRIYSPSYSLPQQTAARAGLQLADGIDPVQLSLYDQFMSGATGIPDQGYSVTVPPFPTGNPAVDNRSYLPDPLKLGLLNVKYIASAFALNPDANLILEKQIGSTWIYQNKLARPRAWIQPDAASHQVSALKVVIQKNTPNEMDVSASGPGLLVLSEVDYPGWKVWVDNQAGSIIPVDTMLRGVELSSGPHQVNFRFIPIDLYLGLGLFALPFLGFIIGSIGSKTPNKERSHDQKAI